MTVEKFNEIEFSWDKHHLMIYHKYRRFLNEFGLEDYVDFKDSTGINHCKQCHSLIGEPPHHFKAKKKIFDLFVDHEDYLVCTELHAKEKALQVFDVGLREYQFDILVINVKNLRDLFQYVETDNFNRTEENHIKSIEHDIIKVIELDGNNEHSWKKDMLRDKFFFEVYNIVTVRYQVRDLVPMYYKRKGKVNNKRHMNNFTKEASEATLENITLEDVTIDAMALYQKRYPIFKQHKTPYLQLR